VERPNKTIGAVGGCLHSVRLKKSDTLLKSWPRTIQAELLDADRTRRWSPNTDPLTCLELRCEAVQFRDCLALTGFQRDWSLWNP